MQFTTVRSKEKDYDIFLKSEKLLQLFEERKRRITAIWRPKKQFTTVRSKEKGYDNYLKNPAIWRPKNVVHNCQE